MTLSRSAEPERPDSPPRSQICVAGGYGRRAGWPTDWSVDLDRGPTSRRGEPFMLLAVGHCATARLIQGRDDAWNPTARKSKLVSDRDLRAIPARHMP